MSVPSISPQKAKRLAKEVFTEIHPDRDLWFDLTWEVFSERVQESHNMGEAQAFSALAMASDSDDAVKELIEHFAVFFEIFMATVPVAREELLQKIQQVCLKHDRGPVTAQQLLKKLNQYLPLENSPDITMAGKPESESHVVVERLLHGKYYGPRNRSIRYAKSVPSRDHYDLVIDELNFVLRIRKPDDAVEEWDILKLPGMQRGMLWLVLTHVSGGILTHDEIGNLFGFKIEGTSNQRRVYQYRIQLGKLLGEMLRDNVIAEGAAKSYRINAESWSFCWIKKEMGHTSSLLIRSIEK